MVEVQRLTGSWRSVITQTNDLLRISNLGVQIFLRDNLELLAVTENGASYSIAQQSDGERSALLLAVEVLTADKGALILIDEPERHLHRSIISSVSLLTSWPCVSEPCGVAWA